MLPVIYVAAGPGDPQLITLRGINAIKQAELVIADVNTMDIANAHANPTADVVAAVDEDGVPMAPAVRARLAIDAAKEGAAATIHTWPLRNLIPSTANPFHTSGSGVALVSTPLQARERLSNVLLLIQSNASLTSDLLALS